jgi:hypothetical protein
VCLPSELTVSARAIADGRARTGRVISVERRNYASPLDGRLVVDAVVVSTGNTLT